MPKLQARTKHSRRTNEAPYETEEDEAMRDAEEGIEAPRTPEMDDDDDDAPIGEEKMRMDVDAEDAAMQLALKGEERKEETTRGAILQRHKREHKKLRALIDQLKRLRLVLVS